MGRALRCHRLFAYNIPCRRPIVGPPQPLSRLDDIRRRRKSLQHCPQVHVHPDCSDAKFMLVGGRHLLGTILPCHGSCSSCNSCSSSTMLVHAVVWSRITRGCVALHRTWIQSTSCTSVELSNLPRTTTQFLASICQLHVETNIDVAYASCWSCTVRGAVMLSPVA
jgi:hypothetical protein